jgi:L-fuculokinase
MTSCIAVYHLQRHKKKLILFDQEFTVIYEETQVFEDISDGDGFPCEDLHKLSNWILQSWEGLESDMRFEVKAVNFISYGSALVHLNQNGEPVAPLFDNRKPISEETEKKFFKTYGNQNELSIETCSPYAKMGNAGFQLYWLKQTHPSIFKKIKTSLFLPQYCSFLFTTNFTTDFTCLGGHSLLWNHHDKRFSQWVYEEGLVDLFPKIGSSHEAGLTPFRHKFIPVGTGLLDSVSGLIPLMKRNVDSFLLLSTGSSFTVLNPFASKELTDNDLSNDCFCYLSFEGTMVKSSRLQAGLWHEQYTKKFASHFFKESDHYKLLQYDPELAANVHSLPSLLDDTYHPNIHFKAALLDEFDSYEQAYHKLMADIVRMELQSVFLAGENLQDIRKMYVEGDYAQNPIFIKMLSDSLPQLKIKSINLNEGPAMGAAMVMKNLAGLF